jgi:hypothetical protein
VNRALARTALVAGLALSGCATTESYEECGFRPGMRAVVPGFCTDRVAALGIADAARTNPGLTDILMRGAMSAGACHFAGGPVAGITVETVVESFRDHKGRLTQVLEGTAAGKSDQRIYAIVLARLARRPQPPHCADTAPEARAAPPDFALLR